MTRLVPVILSGGKGTRLWPVSREARPKPFLKLANGKSLLQATLLRAVNLPDVSSCIIVTNEDYYFQSEDQAAEIRDELGDARIHYLLEPEGRNTAPAIAMAARLARELHGDDVRLLVMPSDHLVSDIESFKSAVKTALSAAAENRIVTFGIEPTMPETGFGYIESGERLPGLAAEAVRRFVEKPSSEKAVEYLASGRYSWNAGMFCFAVTTGEEALARHAGDVAARVEDVWSRSVDASGSLDVVHMDKGSFCAMPDISIDYAVMEKAENIAVVRTSMGWSDIGSWEAMGELVAPDKDGNKVLGEAVLIDTRNTFILSEGRIVATVGIENMIIVDTPDALLVGSRDKSQQVKEVVNRLNLDGHQSTVLHRTVHRPWGTYTVIEEGEHFKIKRLEVKPGAALSLQMHHHRSEHWVVVDGIAEVTNGEDVFRLEKDQSTYIPAGNRHRLANPGDEAVVIIETQTGDYLGEDDIVRFEDQYGRTKGQ